MTEEPNPYAPPSVSETEVPTARYWQVNGIDVLAKNGATLPKVDLESGVISESLKAVSRTHESAGVGSAIRPVLMIGGFLLLMHYSDLSFPLFLALVFISSIVLRRIGAVKGGRITIWTFVEEQRARRMTLRKYARIGLMLSFAFIMLALLFLPAGGGTSTADSFMSWVTWILSSGVACIFGLALWGILDRPKTRLRNGPDGWVWITRVHPKALDFLRDAEEEIAIKDDGNTARKRLVRTAYLYRYPLALLIGRNWKRPLLAFNIILLKLLRSPHLVREAYHFSEADKINADQLVTPLREAVDSWLAAHPGWTFVSGEHLPSPAGDLTYESAILTSPDLETCALITHSWMKQIPGAGATQLTFCSWLDDGSVISTVDHATLALTIPGDREIRASGTPEQVYQTHLAHCAARSVQPAEDLQEILFRFLRKKEQADRLITGKGLQSELREAG